MSQPLDKLDNHLDRINENFKRLDAANKTTSQNFEMVNDIMAKYDRLMRSFVARLEKAEARISELEKAQDTSRS